MYERQELESKPDLTAWDRRRLSDLYEVELRTLPKDSARAASLSAAIAKISELNRSLTDRIDSVKRVVVQEQKREAAQNEAVFKDAEFKKEYFLAYRLWNRDENEDGLQKAIELTKNEALLDRLNKREKFKAFNLAFRIALDLQNLTVAQTAYERMRDLDDCSTEAAEAGFLMALTYLGAGDPKRARTLYEAQCDPDETATNLIKREYWRARLLEASGENAAAGFQKLTQSDVPGYYLFLAHAHIGKPLVFDIKAGATYRKQPLRVPSSVHRLLTEAETSLNAKLRNDATVFLQMAADRMREGAGPSEIPALLYTAHLFQAAGTQLEAMKLYAAVSEISQDTTDRVPFDFLGEMFPRPHSQWVSGLAAEWKLDPDFLYAIMRQESAFNPSAVSPANARGLMQMMPFLGENIAKQWHYGAFYGNRTLFFAAENLKFAAYHLQQLQTQLPHPALMAAAYNAGSKRASNWWKRGAHLPLDVFVELIPILETRNYVKLVLRNFVFYKLLRGNGQIESAVVSQRLPELSSAL